MTRTGRLRSATPLLMLLALTVTAPARAGQVRVDVGPSASQTFLPYVVNINLGDQVVWVWRSNGHSVVNWNLPADSMNINIDGTIFDSDPSHGVLGQPGTTRFSWKSDRVGIVPYVCMQHIPDMTGRIIVTDPAVSPPVDVADFRLSEVQYNLASGQDLIEIANYGLATGNLGRFRIAISSGGSFELAGPAGANVNDIIVPSGGRVVIHLNVAGSNSNTDLFFPAFNGAIGLPNTSGALALYVPNTTSGTPAGNSLSSASMIVDFVQWGAGGQPNETTAVNAGMWGSATFIPTVAAGHSLEYCPDSAHNHGVNRWAEVATPNFGSDGQCLTPVRAESWGRIKTLYR